MSNPSRAPDTGVRESKSSRRRWARVTAMQALYRAEVVGDDLGLILDELGREKKLPEAVRGYAVRLLELFREHDVDIDRVLEEALDRWNLRRITVVDRCVLRLGAVEILYLDEVPLRVTLDEAIEIAKRFGSTESGRFVNGVLDRVARERAGQEQND